MPEITKALESSGEDLNQEQKKATPAEKKLDKVADDAAKQAERTEHRYDEQHDIFTK